ncbi:MAG: hypothetical protein PHS07_01820 [Patescibacteria group bacterium]|nr:hypothetical protein [Patescibacteria group bacterium]
MDAEEALKTIDAWWEFGADRPPEEITLEACKVIMTTFSERSPEYERAKKTACKIRTHPSKMLTRATFGKVRCP